MPFNPSGYLSKFSASGQLDSPPFDEPPNTETRLVCEYALLAVIYDFALDVDTCDRLCGTDEFWPSSLWQNLSSPLTLDDFNNLDKISSMIDTAVKHVKKDLDKLPKGKKTPSGFSVKNGQVFYNDRELELPSGEVQEQFSKLVDKSGRVVLHQELDSDYTSAMPGRLPQNISMIRKALKSSTVPYSIKTYTNEGYCLKKHTKKS